MLTDSYPFVSKSSVKRVVLQKLGCEQFQCNSRGCQVVMNKVTFPSPPPPPPKKKNKQKNNNKKQKQQQQNKTNKIKKQPSPPPPKKNKNKNQVFLNSTWCKPMQNRRTVY